MSKLQHALAWARRNFRVFPLQAGSRLPLEMAWTLHATTDEAVIRGWWTDPVLGVERDHNVGFLTTDWVVLDVDVKNGKPGLNTMLGPLSLEFDTLTVRTGSGGYHLYYRGLPEPVGQSPLGVGVDVRSHNGYVVAPGSVVDGREYVVEIDQPVLAFPEHLRHLLKAPRRRAEQLPSDVELDAPENVELAAHWLQHDAPPAVEGMNGDDATYRVCCRMRDYGISEVTALALFLDEYNPRCEPPWDADAARLKVENAYRYATGSPGAASPSAFFGHVERVDPPAAAPSAAAPGGPLPDFGNMLSEDAIPPRAWVMHGVLARRVVTTLVAPGGAGKSLLALIVAAHLAVGIDFLGHKCVKPGKSIIYNAEDDLEEASRRLLGVIATYKLDAAVVVPSIAIWGSDDLELQLTTGTPPVANPAHLAVLTERCRDPDISMVAFDPLVEVHTGRENDTGDMRYVMGLFRALARTCDVPVLVVQHTGKPPNAASSHAGDQMAGRGSSAIPAAARIVLTLTVAKENECLEIGASSKDHASYVRLDGAKANAVAARDRATARWMRWESHRLVNGDGVGVLVPHDAVAAAAAVARAIGEIAVKRMLENGTAGCTLDEAAALANAAGLEATKASLQEQFRAGVLISENRTVRLTNEETGAKKGWRLSVS